MEEAQLIIGGRDVGAKNKATFARLNPISGEEATRASAATVEDAKAAADARVASSPEMGL
jgi:benzaldehyde dehydrogenase (NAD)